MSIVYNLPGELFATCSAPLAPLLEDELNALGAREIRSRGAGVTFVGDLALAYRACLWSRLASRVLLPLGRVAARDGDALYHGARELDWAGLFSADATFAVDCTVRRAAISHSHFAALRLKDAIADAFRASQGRRPDVDTRAPDIRVHLHLRGSEGRIALDLAGNSLHQRGYRRDAGPAPLRETLAAAVLAMAGWPDTDSLPALLDPMCGAGTLLIEGALMAGDVAPGLTRERFGFEAWHGHDAQLWATIVEEARARRARGLGQMPEIRGADRDARVIDVAARNVSRAGLDGLVTLEVRDLASWLDVPPIAPHGLLASNPPYGGRMNEDDARHAREQVASLIDGSLHAWRKVLLLPDDRGWPEGRAMRSLSVTNGALPCRIHVMEARDAPLPTAQTVDTAPLLNRLKRNQRRLKSWLKREGVTCYRLYDGDLPEFNLAIDLYRSGSAVWAQVQEYAAPPQVEPHLAAARRDAALAVLPKALGTTAERLVRKTRERQRGSRQYQRHDELMDIRGDDLEVCEDDVRLLVNLHEYLDTGLFLDHRPVRRWIRQHSAGARFLNLFAYTGAATVSAAVGGARETLSVDLSRRYLEWAERNLSLNGFGPPHHRVHRADCLAWLAQERPHPQGAFDLIFLDPPTFSNSKRMQHTFDVQRDHVTLIRQATSLLAPQGTLVFSSNCRGFRLDDQALADLAITDWTRPSIPPDYSRPTPPHRCWLICNPT